MGVPSVKVKFNRKNKLKPTTIDVNMLRTTFGVFLLKMIRAETNPQNTNIE